MGRKRLDLTGQRFGKLTAKYPGSTKHKYIYWICICDCGIEKEVRGSHLKDGSIKACGCEGGLKTHGNSRSDKINFYRIWQGIKTRCYNKNSYPYKDYGGRGIRMSNEWINNFEQFYIDMYPTYEIGLTIERKEVNGNYCKENCIWATRAEQAKNRRSTIWVETLQGRMTVNDACKIAGISWPAMRNRMHSWPIEKLLISATNPNKGR